MTNPTTDATETKETQEMTSGSLLQKEFGIDLKEYGTLNLTNLAMILASAPLVVSIFLLLVILKHLQNRIAHLEKLQELL